jgi:hypothetical protein
MVRGHFCAGVCYEELMGLEFALFACVGWFSGGSIVLSLVVHVRIGHERR